MTILNLSLTERTIFVVTIIIFSNTSFFPPSTPCYKQKKMENIFPTCSYFFSPHTPSWVCGLTLEEISFFGVGGGGVC